MQTLPTDPPARSLFALAQEALNAAEEYGKVQTSAPKCGRAPDEYEETVREIAYRRRHELLTACRKADERGQA